VTFVVENAASWNTPARRVDILAGIVPPRYCLRSVTGFERGTLMRWSGAAAGLLALTMLAGCGSGDSIGVILYDPTGVAYRHKLESDKTLNVAVGLNRFETDLFHGHVDYIMHFDSISRGDWNPYWGLGGGYVFQLDDNAGNDDVVGLWLRVPLGISYQEDTWDFFAQIVLDVGSGVDFSAGLGIRFEL